MFSNIVFQTVLSGTLIYIFGQIIQMFILEKIYKYREILGKIDNRLKFYFKIIKVPGKSAHPIERLQASSQELLQLSCDLESCRKQLIFRSKQADKNVSQASKLLIDLHFGVFGENSSDKNLENLEEIRKLLNIPKLSE
ncbi:MAG: hypothetical protein ABIE43_01425 [Patescibacteria group bacterium]